MLATNYPKNKRILEAKLAITNKCVLRCKYCFVDKPKIPQIMDFDTARKAIDLFLQNGGGDKILKIYGGEPLLNFNLLKEIVPYIKKNTPPDVFVQLSICTNAVMLQLDHLSFLKKHKFQIAVSFDGKMKTHDKYRRFRNNRGSFVLAAKNFPLLLKILDKKNIDINIGIVPSEVSKLFDNVQYVWSQGFDTFNLEPIHGFERWGKEHQEEFERQMKKILKFMMDKVLKKEFLFLTTINRELKYKTLSRMRQGVCLFDQYLEVYPDGKLGFFPFIFELPQKLQAKYIIGDLKHGTFKKKYQTCSYIHGKRCRNCLEDYFDILDTTDATAIVNLRNLFSMAYANMLVDLSKKKEIFNEYVCEAKKRICF